MDDENTQNKTKQDTKKPTKKKRSFFKNLGRLILIGGIGASIVYGDKHNISDKVENYFSSKWNSTKEYTINIATTNPGEHAEKLATSIIHYDNTGKNIRIYDSSITKAAFLSYEVILPESQTRVIKSCIDNGSNNFKTDIIKYSLQSIYNDSNSSFENLIEKIYRENNSIDSVKIKEEQRDFSEEVKEYIIDKKFQVKELKDTIKSQVIHGLIENMDRDTKIEVVKYVTKSILDEVMNQEPNIIAPDSTYKNGN
jgi:hypothetical protein